MLTCNILQSVEQYSKKTGARVLQTEPKPVVEYLVFQKRMWFDTPWTIRGQVYEELDVEYKNTDAPNTVRVRAR